MSVAGNSQISPIPTEGRHALQTHSITPTSPLGSSGVHAQNLSRSNGSEPSWALIQKLKRKKVTKVFSENRIKLNIQHGHKPSFTSLLNGKVFDIFLSTRPDFHPNDLSWTGKGRDPPRWLHKWRHKFSTGHEKSLTENFFLFLWFCHH